MSWIPQSETMNGAAGLVMSISRKSPSPSGRGSRWGCPHRSPGSTGRSRRRTSGQGPPGAGPRTRGRRGRSSPSPRTRGRWVGGIRDVPELESPRDREVVPAVEHVWIPETAISCPPGSEHRLEDDDILGARAGRVLEPGRPSPGSPDRSHPRRPRRY